MIDYKLDAKVAEKVMGWKVYGHPFPGPGRWITDQTGKFIGNIDGGNFNQKHWLPSVDAASDYEVLKHVRETWDDQKQDKFYDAISDVYGKRSMTNRRPDSVPWVMLYEPGDWSRAALKALGEDI